MSELSDKRARSLIQQEFLSPEERSALAAHLGRCENCREHAQAHVYLSRHLYLEPVRAQLAPERRAAMLQRIESQHRRNVIKNTSRSTIGAAVALAVLAVIVGVFIWWQSGSVDTGALGAVVETAEPASSPESSTPQIETAAPTDTPRPPTTAASATESQPATTETALTPVSPFTEGSIGPGQQEAYSFISSSGEEIVFWLYLPEAYDGSQTWPLIISLHGYLGFEPSLERVREQSPPAHIGPDVEVPFIVISPRAPSGSWALYHEPMNELIEFLGGTLSIDPDGQFLTGLSAGAIGTWQWAFAFPDRFAGIALIAGTLSINPNDPVPENICLLKDLPVWVAHSEADSLPIESHRAAVMALEECGSTVAHFTTYTDLSHSESVSTAYAGPELYDWMLALMDEGS